MTQITEFSDLFALITEAGIGKSALVTPPKVKKLNEKAMLVKLVTRKPTTKHNDNEAAKVARTALGDEGITASTTLFVEKSSPIRALLNEQGAVYQFHKKKTNPYEDRGDRLLPVPVYESYRDSMRVLIADVNAKVTKYRNDPSLYDKAVQDDIAFRNAVAVSRGATGRASIADYQTCAEFLASFEIEFRFKPLPDSSHYLFDIDEEDRATLDAHEKEVEAVVRQHLADRLKGPLAKLLDTLNTETVEMTDPVTGVTKKVGVHRVTREPMKTTGIFRETTLTNLTEAIDDARALAMDDPDVLAACNALDAALPKTIRDNSDVLRESPVVREAQARKLQDVASKMSAFFGGN